MSIEFEWIVDKTFNSVSRRLIVFRDKDFPVQMEITVPKRKGKSGRPRIRYYLNDDPIEYRSEEELIEAVKRAQVQVSE